MNQKTNFPPLPLYRPLDIIMVRATAVFPKPKLTYIDTIVWQPDLNRWLYFFPNESTPVNENDIIGKAPESTL